MSDTQSPKSVMSYEQIMGLFQKIAEDSQKAQEEAKKAREEAQEKADKAQEEYKAERAQFQKELEKLREAAEKQRRITDKKISDLGDRIGQLVEEMVEGGVVRKFNKLGYTFNIITKRGTTFESKELGLSCEVDLFLENGEYALAVEVKAKTSVDDVKDHIERMAKLRRFADVRNDQRKFIAAIGGGVIPKHVKDFALDKGMYVITQSGETVDVESPPQSIGVRNW